jgi:hypothetical protein
MEKKAYDLAKIDWAVWEKFRSLSSDPEWLNTMNQRLRDWFKTIGHKLQIPEFKRLGEAPDSQIYAFLHLGLSEEHLIRTLLGDMDINNFDVANSKKGLVSEGQHRSEGFGK